MRLKTSKGKKVTYLFICVFVLFVRAKKREQKKEKSPQNVDVLNTDVPTTTLMLSLGAARWCVRPVWTH